MQIKKNGRRSKFSYHWYSVFLSNQVSKPREKIVKLDVPVPHEMYVNKNKSM